ncbi:hypothetical protein DCO58_11845 [Helicobacter saguini]|uniref:Uncharacterized protein n=1 Tax=Helicobacter saguini TaxID=1548018 RepID=A0A347VQA3_9HELI|nr:hypothetical protein [Helicobacter saguini]MWV61019.1 hypothetical protein [Helicobacter saguini]MWV68312.1 hypothetical protein [Helicobacter saguini]MWV70223.1 hypothetical protein [Helicobacter saguini]MWV72126.1 hypothetical protein [Helicobacter saguini]TLD91629.1 hypothetical protein LS64_011595 [Helicobacter saguini]
MVTFKDFKGTLAYNEILKRYNFKLDSIDKFKVKNNENIDPYERDRILNNSYELINLYETWNAGLGEQGGGIFDWECIFTRFAKKHKKSVLKFYKEQRAELDSDAFNEWINKEHKLDITDLICGEQWQKDEVLRLLACDFLRGIGYLLFDSWEAQNDKKHVELLKRFKAENDLDDTDDNTKGA